MKGGVAKTTLTANIADCLNRRHDARVLVVDVDPQFNATQCLLEPEKYIDHVTEGGCTIIDVFDRKSRASVGVVDGERVEETRELDQIEPVEIREGMDLLPGALDLFRLEMAPGEGRENRLKRYFATLEDQYDYILIDTPPTPSVWMTSALIASNYYVIPVRPDPISLTGIDLLRNIVKEKSDNFDLKTRCAGVVLTVVEENTNVYKRARSNLEAHDFWSSKLFRHHLKKRVAIATNQLKQETIMETGDVDAVRELALITRELISRTGNGDV